MREEFRNNKCKYVDGDTFTLLSRANEKYRAYGVYTQKEYHTGGLGFQYKKRNNFSVVRD